MIRHFFKIQKVSSFSHFSMKIYVLGTNEKHLCEVLLMSSHNMRFCGKIRKSFIWIFLHSSDKRGVLCKYVFSYFSMKIYVVGTH